MHDSERAIVNMLDAEFDLRPSGDASQPDDASRCGAGGPTSFGPTGAVSRLVQAVGVDAVLAGFIAWMARQHTQRPDHLPITTTPSMTRRRYHRCIDRFLRWHHGHETGLGLPYGGDGGVAAYYAALRQSGAGDTELARTRQALRLLADYAETGHPYWKWTS